MITSNVYQRTFFIRFAGATGTAFTVDVDGRQYIVTAQHVIDGIEKARSIEIFRDGEWRALDVRIVGTGDSRDVGLDVAVLAADTRISPAHPLPATSAGIAYGQQVFFLGFPYGLHTMLDLNNGFPLAIVKSGIISGSIGHGPGEREVFLLDGHNNPGFSGGPVVFRHLNQPNGQLRVMGVVSAYRSEAMDVTLNGKPTGLTSVANTGIVLCPSIKRATDMIQANPVGFPLAL